MALDVSGYKCECGRTFYSYTEMLYHKHPEDIEKEKEKEKVRVSVNQLDRVRVTN